MRHPDGRFTRLRSRALATLLLSVAALLSPVTAGVAAANTVTVTFNYTGAPQQWTVPAGVTEITVEAWGAQGGYTDYPGTRMYGGRGGYAAATMAVSPGQILTVAVGGAGDGAGQFGVGKGGWNGGADSGMSHASGFAGGGGGGATTLRRGQASLLVAGGGGGVGGSSRQGGAAGGTEGQPGAGWPGGHPYDGGGGGTQSAGGAGGFPDGNPGGLGVGGRGADGREYNPWSGGGGGGGYYGGGGGGIDWNSNNGSGGGGGGSSKADFPGTTSPTTVGDIRTGHGLLTITHIANTAPSTGSHAPASGTSWNHTAAQEFGLTATDTQGDNFTAEFVITPTGGGAARTLTSGSTPSGQQATVTANPELAPGEYTWQARACDTLSACSDYTAARTLTVLANASPVISASGPADATTWLHHSAQSFTVTAADPESDTYHAQIVVTPDGGGTPRTLVTTTGLSGQSVTANPDPGIEPGSYTWQVRACDSLGACGAYSAARALTVHANRGPVTTLASPNDGGTWGYNATQTFTVSGTDTDGDSYSAEIEVTPSGGGTARTLATAFTASGQEVSATMSPALSPGSYTWRARSCDTLALCGAFTASRSFTVSPNLAPTVSLVSPADGAKARTTGPHAFTVSASDPDLDRYTAEVVVTPASGGASRTMTSGLTLSGQSVTLTASPALAAGSYTWKARACDQGAVCSSYTATRTLTVNDPPAAPTIVQPGPDYLFEPGEAQQFSASAVDPEADSYSLQIDVQNLAGATQRTLTTATGASGSVLGVTATPALAPGAYRWRARGCDTASGTCGAYTPLQGVTVHDVAGCPTVVVDGWIGDLYTRVRRGSGPGTVSVCFGTATANAPVQGGRLQISGLNGVAPSVTVVDAAACMPIEAGTALRDTTLAGSARLRVDLREAADHYLVCAYLGRDGSALAHTGVKVEKPSTGQVPDVQVIPATGVAPPPRGPLLPQRPSAACQASTSAVRVINANVFGEWVSVHALQTAAGSQLCSRVDGSVHGGGTVQLAPGSLATAPVTVTPGFGPEDSGSPCGTELVRDNSAAASTLLTGGIGDPLALCLRIRAITGHEVELTTVLDVSPSVPDPTAVWRPDPS